MSIESAKAFIERMKTDEDFAKKVTACKNWETARPIIMGEGYDFSIEEFKSLQQELSDEALGQASGGRPGCACYLCGTFVE